MDTTVITVEEADYGVGRTDRAVFPDSQYVVDERGDLHIHRRDNAGNVGSFPAGSWRAVIRGNLQPANNGVTEVTVGPRKISEAR